MLPSSTDRRWCGLVPIPTRNLRFSPRTWPLGWVSVTWLEPDLPEDYWYSAVFVVGVASGRCDDRHLCGLD